MLPKTRQKLFCKLDEFLLDDQVIDDLSGNMSIAIDVSTQSKTTLALTALVETALVCMQTQENVRIESEQ